MKVGYKVLVTDQIDEIAIKILQDVCEVDYRRIFFSKTTRGSLSSNDLGVILTFRDMATA